MAINLPNDIYTGGAVRVSSQPEVNLYAQVLAKKQAREDALDAYEKNRISRINDKGMRDQDREVLDKALANTMSYYITHKKAIQNGGTPEAYNYEKLWRENGDIISESIDRSARWDAAMKYREGLLKVGRNIPDGFWDDLKAHDLSIGGKIYDHETGKEVQSQSMDLTKYLKQQTPKYDQKKSMDLIKGIKLNDLPVRYEPIAGQPDLRNEIREKQLDAQGLDAIRHIAKTEYDIDDGFAAIIQGKVADPLQRGELETVFEKHFKTKPQGYSDYAIAEKLSQIQSSLVTTKAVSDWPYRTAKVQTNKEKNIKLASALGVGAWKDKYKFNADAVTAGVDKNNVTAQGLVDAAKQPDGTLKLDPEILGLPNYAANMRIDGNDIKYDVNYEGGKKETKSITRESGEKFMANKLDLRVVPIPEKPVPIQKDKTVPIPKDAKIGKQ